MSTVELCIPSHYTGHVSEAQLKIMYEDSRPKPAKKATGLLNALSNVEVRLGFKISLISWSEKSSCAGAGVLDQESYVFIAIHF